tara:strand:- start:2627 stop:2962 length:336 start_codon:yes stop_codon:yes gene_type:complete
MKIFAIIFIFYVVIKETLENYSLIKHRKTYGKVPKKFEGPKWVLVFYIVQGVFNVIYGIVFLRFMSLIESDFENMFYHSALIWIFVTIMHIFKWNRKKLDEQYVEDESNYT